MKLKIEHLLIITLDLGVRLSLLGKLSTFGNCLCRERRVKRSVRYIQHLDRESKSSWPKEVVYAGARGDSSTWFCMGNPSFFFNDSHLRDSKFLSVICILWGWLQIGWTRLFWWNGGINVGNLESASIPCPYLWWLYVTLMSLLSRYKSALRPLKINDCWKWKNAQIWALEKFPKLLPIMYKSHVRKQIYWNLVSKYYESDFHCRSGVLTFLYPISMWLQIRGCLNEHVWRRKRYL